LCLQCVGKMVRWSFEDVELTERSCHGCQARTDLFLTPCHQGSTATPEEVDAGRLCDDIDTGS
jgi:hypothetical protein